MLGLSATIIVCFVVAVMISWLMFGFNDPNFMLAVSYVELGLVGILAVLCHWRVL